jgi:DNA-binding transcriptional regulator YdaS (Cro superfamily)
MAMDMKKLKPLERAIEFIGSQAKLAKVCGVHQTTVWGWLHEMRGWVPGEYAEVIERATDGRVKRDELRPDLYP